MANKVFDMRIFVVLFFNIIFTYMLSAVNSMLSFSSLSLVLPVLFLIGPCYFLKFSSCIIVVVLSAFYYDAFSPLDNGLLAALWLLGALFLYLARNRYRNPSYVWMTCVGLIANQFLFLLYAIIFPKGEEFFLPYISRIFIDNVFSILIGALAIPFVLSLQKTVFRFMGIDIYSPSKGLNVYEDF